MLGVGARLLCTVLALSALQGCQGPETTEGWRVTTYITPVSEFYDGAATQVRGHPDLHSEAEVDLGSYPADFVAAVKEEGCGKISTGEHAGQYLNWSHDTGYWLDVSTRDSHGDPLVPFRTAAVDGEDPGTRLEITDCGRNEDGSAVDDVVCRRLQDARWVVHDEFTPGYGGEKHVDLYLGEQEVAEIDGSPVWIAWTGATVTLRTP